MEVRSEDRASGISFRSRPVKISARFATYTLNISIFHSLRASSCARTRRVFLVARISPSSLQASTPRVFPSNRISSTSSRERSPAMWGSRSAAVVSLRPLPSREKTFVGEAMASKALNPTQAKIFQALIVKFLLTARCSKHGMSRMLDANCEAICFGGGGAHNNHCLGDAGIAIQGFQCRPALPGGHQLPKVSLEISHAIQSSDFPIRVLCQRQNVIVIPTSP
jgi:hypothetical protein